MHILDLGPLEVDTVSESGDVSVGVSQRIVGAKQIALLSMLALNMGKRVSLDELKTAGWGEDAIVADATIENHVWRLRRTIEPHRQSSGSRLLSDSGGYRLALEPDEVDSIRFERIVERARAAARGAQYAEALQECDRALGLWRAAPFEIITHVPTAEAAIARLHELHAQVSEWRIDALIATGEMERAVVDGEALIAASPYRERLWAQRMTALARLSRNDDALQVYQRARALLRDDLGMEPGRELQELQRAIIAQEQEANELPAGRVQGPPAAVPGRASEDFPRAARWMRPEWPLVGRRVELERIGEALADMSSVVIRATAGVGSSRMLDEALRAASPSGAYVLRLVATRSGSAVPLGIFADVLPPSVRSDDVFTLLHRSTNALRERAGGRRLVIGIDDAQLLDDPSAALLLHLASSGTAMIVATVRIREPVPDAVAALERQSAVVRVDLEPLDEDGMAELTDAILGAPAETAAHRWVHRTARGNAFYASELIRAARADGRLRWEDDRWVLVDASGVPGSLAELVQETLDRLDDPHRRVVDVLAMGEPLRVADLGLLCGMESVVDLERAGLIAVEETGAAQIETKVVIAHPLYGAVLRAVLPPLRAHRIRRELIDVFAGHTDLAADERLRLARWRVDAGDIGDADELVTAASLALGSNDPALALEFASLAIGESAGDQGSAAVPGGAVAARLCLARAHILRREYAAAEAALSDLEPSLQTQRQALDYLEAQNDVQQWGQARSRDMAELLERARLWWADPEWRDRLAALSHRLSVFDRLADMPSSDVDRDSTTTLVSARIGSLFYAGRSADALALCRDAEVPPPFHDLDQAIYASLGARIELERGDTLVDLERRLMTLRDAGLDADDPAAVGIAAYALSEVRLLRGDPAESLVLLAEAERHLYRRDPTALLAAVLAGKVIAAREMGDHERMRRELERMREAAGAEPLAHLLPYTARAEAWYAVEGGELERAWKLLSDATTRLQASPIHRARLGFEAMRTGRPAGELVAALEEAASQCDAPFVALYAEHARARAGSDADALRAVADRWDGWGAEAYRALADADARGVDVEG